MKFKRRIILNPGYDLIKVPRRTILGLYEYITMKNKTIGARIDTGAVKSSIDIQLASELGLGPIIGSRIIRNVHGSSIRSMVEQYITIGEKRLKVLFTLQNRSRMKFKILIGQNVLKKDFIVDPKKTILAKVQE